MSYPNGGQPPQQPGQPGQPQPGQPQQWSQQQPGQQTWGQAAQTGFNNAKASSGFDVKTVPWWLWAILGGWVLYIVALSLPALTAETDGPYGISDSASGWNYGLHVFGFILVTLAVIAVVASWFVKDQLAALPFPFGFVTGGLAAVGALLGLIGFIVNVTDGDSGYGYSVGPSFGTWITLVVLLVIAAGAAFELMQALKQPKPAGGAAGGQWGQPAAPPQQQWGASQQPPAQPQSGGFPAQPQQPPAPPQQPGQPPQGGQWGQPPQG
ncbi:MAG: hypothetical protein ACK5MR_03880 [Cumulibacter sp.]